MRRWILGLVWSVALACGGIGGVAYAYPAATAAACPSCYGFELVAPDVFVGGAPSPETRAGFAATVETARSRVRAFYERLDGHPRILMCATDACYRRVGGGGSKGMALLDMALFVSPRGANSVVVSHELSHIELHSRLGLVRTVRRDVPQWFDEGLAVTVSDDPRYLAAPGNGDRCLIESNEPLPVKRQSWVESAASHDLYAKAACRVSRWLDGHGGAKAVLSLIEQVDAGQDFEAAYHAPAT